jgi:hypothetical protein
MKTTIQTSSEDPIKIAWDDNVLITRSSDNTIIYTNYEAIELRDFLNQLDLK